MSKEVKWTVRPMRHEDIDKCLVIWSRVGLTEARQTVTSALAADPEGFYVAELDGTGEVVGMCSSSMTRNDTAFMGFYGVEPKYQHIGIGRELWSRTIGRLEESINVGLYGVPTMSEKYKKSGFINEDSTRMLIYESEQGANDKLNIDSLKDISELIGCRLVVIDGKTSDAMFNKLVAYDQSVQRFSREKLLRLYLTGDDVPLTLAVVKDHSRTRISSLPAACEHSTAAAHHHNTERKSSCCAKPSQESIFEDEALSTTAKSSLLISANPTRPTPPTDSPSVTGSTTAQAAGDEYEVLGYGCIRLDNNSGGIIGPIYADSGDLCEVILKNLMSRFELNSGVYSVMALSSNRQACKILTKVGLNETEECARMFTKFVPSASFSKIYYVHSPNFTLF